MRLFMAVAAVALCAPVLASSQPFPNAKSNSIPLLSGAYTVLIHEHCQPTLTVSYQAGAVNGLSLAGGSNNLDAIDAGTLSFTQGGTSGTGTFKGKFRTVDGSVFVVSGAGNSGSAWDQPSTQSSTGSFTQTATKLTITFTGGGGKQAGFIYYGASSGGVAQHAVFGGARGTNCMDDFTLDHQ